MGSGWGSDGHPPGGTRDGGESDGGPPAGTRDGRYVRALFSVAHKFPRGDPRRSHPSRKLGLTATALLLFAVGCGEGEGVAEDATVTVYVSAPLCAGAKQELARSGGRSGDLHLRAVCVNDGGSRDDGNSHKESRLAAIGAAARQATEDSSSVAYIGTADPTAVRFSEPILEEADIPRISADSGEASMTRLLRALQRADDSGSLRESLAEELR